MNGKKFNQMLDALSHLDMDMMLNYVPKEEFQADGALTEACRIAGYSENAFYVASRNFSWNLPVAEFAEFLADDDD